MPKKVGIHTIEAQRPSFKRCFQACLDIVRWNSTPVTQYDHSCEANEFVSRKFDQVSMQ